MGLGPAKEIEPDLQDSKQLPLLLHKMICKILPTFELDIYLIMFIYLI